MKKIVVLGAGLVGKTIAIDLSANYRVTAVDLDPVALGALGDYPNISTLQADLSDLPLLGKIIGDFDLVIGAMPGRLGFGVLRQVIGCGKNIIDISFMPEDPFELDDLAKEKGVTAVVDCGIAPGMGNMILGYHSQSMKVDHFECLVGGLPVERVWPWQYKAVFSPIDVIEEYTRPARFVIAGKIIEREALSDPELVNFDQLGTLEAWNSDGLRTLIRTMDIPNMTEKTLRYPGTIEYLRVLREAGFFSYEETEIQGKKIRPVDLTSKLLFEQWKLKPGEEDLTVMRIKICGEERGEKKKYIYSLLDRYDNRTGTTSMARTTGYTCTAVARLCLEKQFSRKGICPPEFIGEKPGHFRYVMDYLKSRNIEFMLHD